MLHSKEYHRTYIQVFYFNERYEFQSGKGKAAIKRIRFPSFLCPELKDSRSVEKMGTNTQLKTVGRTRTHHRFFKITGSINLFIRRKLLCRVILCRDVGRTLDENHNVRFLI